MEKQFSSDVNFVVAQLKQQRNEALDTVAMQTGIIATLSNENEALKKQLEEANKKG